MFGLEFSASSILRCSENPKSRHLCPFPSGATMSLPSIPARCCVAVIGGGPAGSSTATLLAREGMDVVLLERDRFPRYHIGESLLLSARQMFDLLGVEEKVAKAGFVKKYGAYFKIKQGLNPGHIDFSRARRYNHSYQVIRSEFDKLLLDHASECGVKVFEETQASDVEFDGDRPIAIHWKRGEHERGSLSFEYLVDASGLSGMLATRYLKSRVYQENFANVAVGRYFRGYRPYREVEPGAFYMEALSNSSGWTWFIPLHDGTVSVGIVVHRDEFARMKQACGGDYEQIFAMGLKFCPDITRLLSEAVPEGGTHVWQDYSYVAQQFAGPHYRLVGDAAGFIDPFFSSGVHMAFLSGLSAAATICSSIKGEVEEWRAGVFHDRCVRRAYTRFVLAVSGVYMQIRNQTEVVLHGVANEDLQMAFNLLQPVVSGAADIPRTPISKATLKKAMKYVSDTALELHGGDSHNAIAKLVSKKPDQGQLPFFEEASGLGAIDGLYIRAKPGRLGLARNRLFLSGVTWVLSAAASLLVRCIMPGLFARETAATDLDAAAEMPEPQSSSAATAVLHSASNKKSSSPNEHPQEVVAN